MTKSNYKVELRKKKIFSIPYNTQIFSMFAIILIIGAPAVVSMIDDSYTTDVSVLSTFDDEDITVNYKMSEEWAVPGALSMLKPSENNGSYLFAANVADDVPLITWIFIDGFEISDFENLGRIEMTTNSVPSSITFYVIGDGLTSHSIAGNYDADTEVWNFDFDSVDRAKIGSDGYTSVTLLLTYTAGTALSFTELTIVPYGTMIISYGEIIIGLTGGLLLICALFSTPWFGIGGLNIKKKRRA